MQVHPYLDFNGRCDEAIEFYKKALGAEVQMLMRFKDAPPQPQQQEGGWGPSAGSAEKVMHATVHIGESVVHMSDGRCQGSPNFAGIALSLAVKDDAQAAKAFAALNDGGKVLVPLGKTFYASSFGMVHDRFGVLWMVIVDH